MNQELLNKIKKGLVKSGFPLELKVAKNLQEKNWGVTIGSSFLDFETNTFREADSTAKNEINGIKVHLIIDCKKSDSKQLILYQPESNSNYHLFKPSNYLVKFFPKPANEFNVLQLSHISLTKALKFLPICDRNYALSSNIIFTSGDHVEQNNVSFFSSLNGLLKRSIIDRDESYELDRNYRSIYLYIIIYDGYMLSLKSGGEDDIDLKEIDYGKYKMQYYFSFPIETPSSIINQTKVFGNSYIIEIMKPNYLETYIDQITNVFEAIDKSKLEKWGEDWPELPF